MKLAVHARVWRVDMRPQVKRFQSYAPFSEFLYILISCDKAVILVYSPQSIFALESTLPYSSAASNTSVKEFA